MGRFVDWICDGICQIGFPFVLFYHLITMNPFLNVAATDAVGLEKGADTLLIPFQYLFAGREASRGGEQEEWIFTQRFDYSDRFWIKTGFSAVLLPPSLIGGSLLKAIAYLATSYSSRLSSIQEALQSTRVISQIKAYQEMGLDLGDRLQAETLISQGYQRGPGDDQYLQKEKEALREIGTLLNEENIVWWVDCGTCLGAYRYGGVIPWDFDIDMAILLPDFDNVFRLLHKLDQEKYTVLDWSSREFPKSLIRVYVKETGSLIDLYHFMIDPKKREIRYLLSQENNVFLPESWKIRERRFTQPISFDAVFPLKKAVFDGVEVFVPRDPEKYLQRYYGENLSPVKIFDPSKGSYEKDLTHPYWGRMHAH